MQMQADTVYDHTKPWRSNEERLTDDALRWATVPGAVIATEWPPAPQMLDRPRYGYPSYNDRQFQITQIGVIPQMYPVLDYSGSVSGYSGSLRNGFPALNTF